MSLRSYFLRSEDDAEDDADDAPAPQDGGTALRFLPDSLRSPVSEAVSSSFSRESERPGAAGANRGDGEGAGSGAPLEPPRPGWCRRRPARPEDRSGEATEAEPAAPGTPAEEPGTEAEAAGTEEAEAKACGPWWWDREAIMAWPSSPGGALGGEGVTGETRRWVVPADHLQTLFSLPPEGAHSLRGFALYPLHS